MHTSTVSEHNVRKITKAKKYLSAYNFLMRYYYSSRLLTLSACRLIESSDIERLCSQPILILQ